MERVEVKSSALSAIAYDAAQETLETVFHANKFGLCAVWHYKPVSQEQYDAFFAEGVRIGQVYAALKATPGIVSYKVGEETLEPAR
jgi:hypothetical protein